MTLVNPIYPGLIQMDMAKQTFVCPAGNAGTNDVEAARQMAVLTHPIGRLGVPDDITKGVLFPASDNWGFTTAVGLGIDSGPSAR